MTQTPLEHLTELAAIRDQAAEALAQADAAVDEQIVKCLRAQERPVDIAREAKRSDVYVRRLRADAGIAPRGGYAAKSEAMRAAAAERKASSK